MFFILLPQVLCLHLLALVYLLDLLELFSVLWVLLVWYTHKGITFTHLFSALLTIWEDASGLVPLCCTLTKLVKALGLQLH